MPATATVARPAADRMPRFALGDEVPVETMAGTRMKVVTGIRRVVDREEVDDDGIADVDSGWEYRVSRINYYGWQDHWGWVKQSEIEKEQARVDE